MTLAVDADRQPQRRGVLGEQGAPVVLACHGEAIGKGCGSSQWSATGDPGCGDRVDDVAED